GPDRSDRTPISRLGQKRSPRESDRHCGHSGWRGGFGAGSGQWAALPPHPQGHAGTDPRLGRLVFFDHIYDDHHMLSHRAIPFIALTAVLPFVLAACSAATSSSTDARLQPPLVRIATVESSVQSERSFSGVVAGQGKRERVF